MHNLKKKKLLMSYTDPKNSVMPLTKFIAIIPIKMYSIYESDIFLNNASSYQNGPERIQRNCFCLWTYRNRQDLYNDWKSGYLWIEVYLVLNKVFWQSEIFSITLKRILKTSTRSLSPMSKYTMKWLGICLFQHQGILTSETIPKKASLWLESQSSKLNLLSKSWICC